MKSVDDSKTQPHTEFEGGEDQVMPKVTVEADAEYDPEYYTDPYNKDYVLPNATAGTKTDTPIMETPLNVQVISKQVLKERQAFTLTDALRNVSGVRTGLGPGGSDVTTPSIFLRGFDSTTFFRDGFRLTQGAASREFANVESVEVLKGSAAILYGLIEPGGMVNVITKKPLATPYYGFTQQFGSYNLYRTTLDATGPLTKNKDLLYRVNMSYQNSDSFRDLLGNEDVFFAPKLTWNISPRTQANFELEYNRSHLGLDTGSILPIINGQLLRVPRSRNYAEYSPLTNETVFGSFNWSHAFNEDWTLKHRFSVNQASQFIPVISFPVGVGPADVFGDGSVLVPSGKVGRNYNTGKGFNQYNTYANNVDVVGHFDTWDLKHTLLLGGDHYRIDNNLNSSGGPFHFNSLIDLNRPVHPRVFVRGGGVLAQPAFANITKLDQFGLYTQDQIKLPYDVHVTGGIRWQYIHQSQKSVFSDGSQPTNTVQTQDAVTPRVGILWNPKPWLSLYANYTESFGANSGLTFVRPGLGKIIAPTSAAQYEGGLKFQAFDGKLRATLAYYDLTKTNVAVADPIISHNCGAGPGSCSIAIGEIRSRGPELDIQGEILPGWNVIANWTNLDIIVTKGSWNPNDPNVNPAGDSSLGGKVGDRLFGQPRNTGSLWSTYTVQDGGL
ncbi:MAG: TonB-dependent siderophore receptor [Methylococcaceae bacterium]|nr:TonB-dependent siderophore receptor [Methylococcaceae bacterium]